MGGGGSAPCDLGLYTRVILVGQDRRHLFVTLCCRKELFVQPLNASLRTTEYILYKYTVIIHLSYSSPSYVSRILFTRTCVPFSSPSIQTLKWNTCWTEDTLTRKIHSSRIFPKIFFKITTLTCPNFLSDSKSDSNRNIRGKRCYIPII
jgi:hypothetical protein